MECGTVGPGLVIQQLVKDLAWDTKLILCPTVRDTDGLALSSRNQYLTIRQRRIAVQLYHGLSAGKRAIQGGSRSTEFVSAEMRKFLTKESQIKIDYLAICDTQSLEPTQSLKGNVALLGAIRLGKIRLIDNILVRKA